MDPSQEGLLHPASKQRRLSHDSDAYDDFDSDIDASEYLNTVSKSASPNRKPSTLCLQLPRCSISRFLSRRSRCCLILIAIAVVIWVVIGAGGAFIYKKYKEEPPYGQSPPWYPAPRGGSAASWAASYEKAQAMVRRMTLVEKVNVTTGTGWMMGLAVGTNGPAVHVGFPQLQLQDGPLGIRFADHATAFPAGITVGATWNRELMYARGKAHGNEARNKGINVLLGPCVGPLGRMPAGGRNWEGFGADPYLQGVAGAETVRGIQSEGVMATIKHFVANEQEHFRQPWEWGLPHALSANIDDRTLHELYAWPFADAVKAGVASVMCSYNMVNNSYACGNSKLLNGVLKDELGFQGFVMSDWLAQRSGVSTALAGLDMTMPGDGIRWQDGVSLWGPQLTRAVLNGSVPVSRLNDMVTRIVAAWYQLGQDDESRWPREPPNFSSWTDDKMGVMAPGSKSPQEPVVVNKFVDVQGNHSALARQIAAEGIVLLKNEDSILPLSRNGSGGSRIRRELRERTAVHTRTEKLKIGVFGEDAGPGKGPNFCKDRGCNQGTLGSGWGSGAVEFPYLVSPVEALRSQLNASHVELHEYLDNNPPVKKDETVFGLDICIVFANADSGEGFLTAAGVRGDRNDLHLQNGGDDLVAAVAGNCGEGSGQVIVVIHSVGPVVMERWIDITNVKAVVLANLPGQESGNALADVLFGDVNPSGRLPYTIGKSLQDYGPGAKVMYMPNGVVPQQDFSEGLYVDYRHFDKQDIVPRFEFGFGLSYTTFAVANATATPLKGSEKTAFPAPRPPPAASPPSYDDTVPDRRQALFPAGLRRLDGYIYPYLDHVDDIQNTGETYPYPDGYHDQPPLSGAGGDEGGNPDLWEPYVRVTADVSNTGAVAGKVVVQLYVSYPPPSEGSDARTKAVDFPVKVLRGFEKVLLRPGDSKKVEFNVTRRDLSYWDVVAQNWRMVVDGEYKFLVGQSSRDLPAVASW
ncbi:hypothetical protein VTK73DRAFT_644 [Phialemonium thermophilum]|uniref:beta-glucosidase n=1 Tax=Phialemonium thermophilum TaxID=223376 RepID=A0ABR3XDE8_9PEZI